MTQTWILLVLLHISCTTCFHPPSLSSFQIDVPQIFPGFAKDSTKKVEDLTAGLGNVNDTLQNVLKKLALLQTNKQNTQTDVSKMESSVNDVKASQDLLRSDMDSLSSVVKTLKDEVNHVSQVESAVNDVKASHGVLREDMDALTSVIEGLKEAAKKDPCPISNGFISVASPRLCFKLSGSSDKMHQSVCESQCQSQGGRLIILNTRDKQDYMAQYLNENFGDYYVVWIGMKKVNGVFTWSDGTTNVAQWGDGEPDYLNYQNCVQIDQAGLSDIGCELTRNCLCEISL